MARAWAAEIDAVVQAFKSIPTRPPGLDPKVSDLTDHCMQNLFAETLDLGRLPESFKPLLGVPFDLRGVIRLGSASLQRESPERGEGIPVGQKASSIQFPMVAIGG